MRRGEIYIVDLGRGRGREPGGKRPVLVVSNDGVNSLDWMVTVIPGLGNEEAARSAVCITPAVSGWTSDLYFHVRNVRSLCFSRFPAKALSNLTPELLKQLNEKLREHLDL